MALEFDSEKIYTPEEESHLKKQLIVELQYLQECNPDLIIHISL